MLRFTFSSSLVSHYNVFPVTLWRPVPLIGSMTRCIFMLLLAVFDVFLLAVIVFFKLLKTFKLFYFTLTVLLYDYRRPVTPIMIFRKLFKRFETIRQWVLQHDQKIK